MLTKTSPHTVEVVLSKKRGKFRKGDHLICTQARADALVKSGHVKVDVKEEIHVEAPEPEED